MFEAILFLLLTFYCQFLVEATSSQCSVGPEEFEWPSQFVRSGAANIRVLVQGSGPAVVIIPSYGRDGGNDFNRISAALVEAGYLVLRPQPRGTLGSTGPMRNVTMGDLTADIAQVIDTLAGGQAIVMGHAFGTLVTKVAAANYPEKIPAMIVASAGGLYVPDNIAQTPSIAGNTSLPIATRLAALQLAFFAPNHDAHIWLDGWYPDTLAMEYTAVESVPSMTAIWGGGNTTQILQLIPAYDPFLPRDQWNQTTDMFPDRVVSVVIDDASHALFPEQNQAVLDAILPWLAAQSSKLG
ncbi:putative alpha/beta fold family hydrolase [Glonium stellatum]|uniref:Putative alpha/beta fold family hydrolase n=1 Tax=Glonium stellatum TaxID=574774 RepID=A0A8E2EYE8_9PEZI|nr:putative alpha/beta fold family hydrolase [Glonium stellatum]